jgi:hypothetical protein
MVFDIADLNGLSRDELMTLNRIIVERIRTLDRRQRSMARWDFSAGDTVNFTTREGVRLSGHITKCNPTKAKVAASDGRTWTVSYSLLTKEVAI